jgi:hypothetical protein
MLVNRLVMQRMLQEGMPLAQGVNRATGRTTAIILHSIAQAINDPGEWVRVTDHEHGHNDTTCGRAELAHRIRHVIAILKLDKFAVTDTVMGIRIKSDFAETLE